MAEFCYKCFSKLIMPGARKETLKLSTVKELCEGCGKYDFIVVEQSNDSTKIKFEVINDKGTAVMSTEYISCIPNDSQLTAMSKAGYKFKIDGKAVSVKKIKEFVSNTSNL